MTSFEAMRDAAGAPGSAAARLGVARRTRLRRGSAARDFGSGPGDYPSKRVIDVVLALAAMVALAPLLALIWLAVVVTSEGPGLHWSQRVGRHGRCFWMPKFRTMRPGAPKEPRESLPEAKALITPLGALLRRTSLDELPQLFSILNGDMSFVGPRPLLVDDPGARAREVFTHALTARPGLSGLAQIRGRNQVSARRKARLDALYAAKASLLLDLVILYRTSVIVLTGRGFM